MSDPRLLHPAQRYKIATADNKRVEYVGAVGEYDVFWWADKREVLVKFSQDIGRNYHVKYTSSAGWGEWLGGHNNRTSDIGLHPAEGPTEAIFAMVQCFAQANRPEEWDRRD